MKLLKDLAMNALYMLVIVGVIIGVMAICQDDNDVEVQVVPPQARAALIEKQKFIQHQLEIRQREAAAAELLALDHIRDQNK